MKLPEPLKILLLIIGFLVASYVGYKCDFEFKKSAAKAAIEEHERESKTQGAK